MKSAIISWWLKVLKSWLTFVTIAAYVLSALQTSSLDQPTNGSASLLNKESNQQKKRCKQTVDIELTNDMDRVKRVWYLSPMRAAKVQASLRIRAVSPEPSLLAHTSSESRGTFRQKARSLAPLNGWACAVKICHDGMLEDTNSLDGAHIISIFFQGSGVDITAAPGFIFRCFVYILWKLQEGKCYVDFFIMRWSFS